MKCDRFGEEIYVGMLSRKRRKLIYNALRDLVPFVQFKKREKHPWRSVTFN